MASFPPQSPMPPTSGGEMPAPPPGTPTLSAIPTSSMGGGPVEAGVGGALPTLWVQLERAIDTLARILPQQSKELDAVKTSLRGILAKALSRGTDEDEGDISSGREAGGPY